MAKVPRNGLSPSTKFQKGQSGNPKGRPRDTTRTVHASSYDIIVDLELLFSRDGLPEKISLEEALQFKTYNLALAGNRKAQREILKMIAAREKALAQRAGRVAPAPMLIEPVDPKNAYDALLMLGITTLDQRWGRDHCDGKEIRRYLLLEPWAVQLALQRRKQRKASQQDINEINRCTREPGSVDWPRSFEDG